MGSIASSRREEASGPLTRYGMSSGSVTAGLRCRSGRRWGTAIAWRANSTAPTRRRRSPGFASGSCGEVKRIQALESQGAARHHDKYLEGVTELYQAEIVGEGLFSTWLATCPAEHAYGMALLLQLEGEAKVRLRALPWGRGISLVKNQARRAAGIEEAGKLGRMPWREAMLELAELARPYRDRYRALAAVAPA